MPVPSLPGLVFMPLVRRDTAFLAHLYGVALVLSLAVVPLGDLLARLRLRRGSPVALGLLALLACGGFGHLGLDIPVCLGLLAVAVRLDLHRNPILKAVAGTFYGLAMLSHVVGLAAVVVRVVLLVASSLARRNDRGLRAVNWIQGWQIAYTLIVYLFVCRVFMGDAVYPFRHLSSLRATAPGAGRMTELATRLEQHYADFAPVASGHWGYAAAGLLARHGGHHFIDFHPDRIPGWERRDVLLVVPSETNPLSALSDLDPRMRTRTDSLAGALLLSESANWKFYLVDRRKEQPPTPSSLRAASS
jgi:hypothetical protein